MPAMLLPRYADSIGPTPGIVPLAMEFVLESPENEDLAIRRTRLPRAGRNQGAGAVAGKLFESGLPEIGH